MHRLGVAVWLVFWVLPGHAQAVAGRLAEFEIQDQFKQTHRTADLAGEVVVLVGSDRGGSAFNAAWGKALYDALDGHSRRDDVRFLPVADVRGVPFFMKAYVRGKFPEDPARWTLLDWEGVLAEAYAFHPDRCNIVVFDHEGTLVGRFHGREVDPDRLAELAQLVACLLDARP